MYNFKLFNTLKDIIDIAYPETENTNFKNFYLNVIPKEMKSIHGRYYPKDKKIEIFNMSRPSGHIITTTIHEVSHHIDHYIRNESKHDEAFYEVMHKMLIAAIGMGVITKNDIETATDSADKDRLTKYFGDIESWEVTTVDYKSDIRTFKVSNCFDIKDILKDREYKYLGNEQCWVKDIAIDNVEGETEYLKGIIDMNNVQITSASDISVQAYYYICVSNSYEYKDYLKENGFMWNGYGIKNKSWNKKVLAQDSEEELAKLDEANLENATIKVVGKDSKQKNNSSKSGSKSSKSKGR